MIKIFALLAVCGVRAHISVVCSATHADYPGQTTFFLGTYKHGNSMDDTVSGQLTIDPPSGITQTYSFSTACSTGIVSDTATVDEYIAALKTYVGPFTSWGSHSFSACNVMTHNGNPIVTNSSLVTCYKEDLTPPEPSSEWAEPIYRGSEQPYCLGSPGRDIAVWWVATMTNTVPGIYKMEVVQADVAMQPGTTAPCSIETTAKRFGGSEKGAMANVPVPVAMAGGKCTTDRPTLPNSADTFPTVCDGSQYDIISGFVCPVTCETGYFPRGLLLCDNGRWATENFECTDSPICGVPSSENVDPSLDTDIIGIVTDIDCNTITETGKECFFICSGTKSGIGKISCTDNDKVWQQGSNYGGCVSSCAAQSGVGALGQPVMCDSMTSFTQCCGG